MLSGAPLEGTPATTVTTPAPPKKKPKPDHFSVAKTVVQPAALTGVKATKPPKQPKLDELIDGAKERLFLHIPLNDAEVGTHLIAAAARGVEVRVVATPSKFDQFFQLAMWRLGDAGVDVMVRKQSALEPQAGVVDGGAFIGKLDPITGQPAPTRVTDSAEVQRRAGVFAAEMEAPKASRVFTRTGLLGPETVALHPMPDSGTAPILNAINSATKTIDLEIYQLSDRAVVDALKKAAKRPGMVVRVMVEPETVSKGNAAQLERELKAAGVQFQPTPPDFDKGRKVDHAKLCLIDGRELLFGTGNLQRIGLGGHEVAAANNRDFWVEDTRAANVKEAKALFEADWNRTPTKASDFTHLVVTPDNANTRLLGLVDAAAHPGGRLRVYNQELNDAAMIEHLIKAKQAGADVKVLLGVQPGAAKKPKNEPAAVQLRAAGVQVEYLTRSYLHAKGIVSDNTAFLGSQNFSAGGLKDNREFGATFDQPDFVQQLAAVFDEDFANPGMQP